MLRVVVILMLVSCSLHLRAQSCCSGGVPLSNNIGLSPQQKGTWQLNTSYDLNTLNTLKAGTTVLNDDSRRRQTHSVLFQLGYTFSRRWSAEVFVSYVRQERRIRQFGQEDFTFTQGIGDAVALVKYQLIAKEKQSLFVGLGAKIPTGSPDLRSQQGLRLNADLQPGSGAWDAILWTQYQRPIKLRPSMTWSLTGIYTTKGTNEEYLGNQAYQFGQEVQVISTLSDQVFVAKQIFNPSLIVRYRQVQGDQQNEQLVPGTGGSWLFVAPALAWQATPRFSMSASLELPIFAEVTDTQVTPTHRLQLGLSYLLTKKEADTNRR
ncbi:MAG: transporter [Bacteroidota bacterium]